MSAILLIIDYNLTRIDDVVRMRDYARERYGAQAALIRARPTMRDRDICDHLFDIDPLAEDFVELAYRRLEPIRGRLRAGIVFSDHAVRSGAALLERLQLQTDCSVLAAGAFDKLDYRLGETRHRQLLQAQRMLVPDFAPIGSFEDLLAFAARHPEGFVLKPTCEGNNRGVIHIGPNDACADAWSEIEAYLPQGLIAEQTIPYRREYSVDGLGSVVFVTEKLSAAGRYPVEIGQLLPARLGDTERATLERAGRLTNWLVGQCDGPFHNEIKLSDDGTCTAVVEPNRRPAGMKIWSLARWVYGVDLYHAWIDAAFHGTPAPTLPPPRCSAATVMLGVDRDGVFPPEDLSADEATLTQALAATAKIHALAPNELTVMEFAWLSTQRRQLHRIARDNADFAALVCIVIPLGRADIHDVALTLRSQWQLVLGAAIDASLASLSI